MPLDRLTQITNAGITSGITITGVNLTGVITATSATVGSGITLSGTQINVGSATTIHSGGFRIGSSDIHSTGVSLQNAIIAGVTTVSAGSTSAPSISPSGDSNTGIFFPSADTVCIGEGGAEVLRVDSNGRLGIGTNNPQTNLHIGGATDKSIRINTSTNNSGFFGVYQDTVQVTVNRDGANGSFVDANKSAATILLSGESGGSYISFATAATNNTAPPERIRLTSSGNVGIGLTNPGNKLVVDGYIQTPNYASGAAGLDIGYRKYVSITGNFAANTWYNTGIDRTTDTGTYLVSCYLDSYNAGGQSYQMRYVGWFVMPNQGTNSGEAYGITLHRAGHAPNAETLQLRTLLTGNADGKIYLQWLSNFALNLNETGGRQFYIALHRFATPWGG